MMPIHISHRHAKRSASARHRLADEVLQGAKIGQRLLLSRMRS
ncbi:Uncharacterised protein [Pragia fontium]|nr:Uncharacterised protein [Pragia fontium]